MIVEKIRSILRTQANPEFAEKLQYFFKTGPGQYGESDIFLGISAPSLRSLVKAHVEVTIEDAEQLLQSEIHEERAFALLQWVRIFKQGTDAQKEQIFKSYLANTEWINNWDLVDTSAPHIAGKFLLTRPRQILYKLAKSHSLWERRIAIIATHTFIRNNDFADTVKIAAILVNDKEDLIHKAVGWMLREVGNRDLPTEETFLEKYYAQMPRTMLRYAIEKFREDKRKFWLLKK